MKDVMIEFTLKQIYCFEMALHVYLPNRSTLRKLFIYLFAYGVYLLLNRLKLNLKNVMVQNHYATTLMGSKFIPTSPITLLSTIGHLEI